MIVRLAKFCSLLRISELYLHGLYIYDEFFWPLIFSFDLVFAVKSKNKQTNSFVGFLAESSPIWLRIYLTFNFILLKIWRIFNDGAWVFLPFVIRSEILSLLHYCDETRGISIQWDMWKSEVLLSSSNVMESSPF